MPYSYELDTDARIAYVRSWGLLDVEESLSAPIALSLDPEYEPEFGVVVDIRHVLYEPRARELVEMTRNLLSLREHFRHRVGVVVSERLMIGAELGAAMASAGGVALRVFGALEEAFGWVRPEGRVPAPRSVRRDTSRSRRARA